MKAREFANRALDLAVTEKDKALTTAIRGRIQLYAEGKPFRDDHASAPVARTVADAR